MKQQYINQQVISPDLGNADDDYFGCAKIYRILV